MEQNDGDLIARVLGGDRESFDDLLQRHGSPIWSTLRASLANVEDARDAFQETWLRAYERLGTLREPARLRSWLLSIALNLVRQAERRRRRAPFVSGAREPADDAHDRAGAAGPAEALAEDELVGLVRAELARLPPRQRAVVDLRVHHGLGHGEIAALLGIREDASRANYYQALKRLRARFDGARDGAREGGSHG